MPDTVAFFGTKIKNRIIVKGGRGNRWKQELQGCILNLLGSHIPVGIILHSLEKNIIFPCMNDSNFMQTFLLVELQAHPYNYKNKPTPKRNQQQQQQNHFTWINYIGNLYGKVDF